MLKNFSPLQDWHIFNATIFPILALLAARILSPILRGVVHNAPGYSSNLLLPTAVQGTAYYSSHPRVPRH